jgi:hypothetical protein
MIPPIDDRDTASIGISRRLDAEKARIASSKFEHLLVHRCVLGMVDVCID